MCEQTTQSQQTQGQSRHIPCGRVSRQSVEKPYCNPSYQLRATKGKKVIAALVFLHSILSRNMVFFLLLPLFLSPSPSSPSSPSSWLGSLARRLEAGTKGERSPAMLSSAGGLARWVGVVLRHGGCPGWSWSSWSKSPRHPGHCRPDLPQAAAVAIAVAVPLSILYGTCICLYLCIRYCGIGASQWAPYHIALLIMHTI